VSRPPFSPGERAFAGPEPEFNQALALHRQQRLREAEQGYRRVLKADDRHFGALYQLGRLRLQQARWEDAIKQFRRAVNVERNSAEAHHHLAVALAAAGSAEEALQRYEKALTIRELAETHNNLAHLLDSLDRTDEAIAHYEKALAIKPAYAEAHNNLANALHKVGRSEEAFPHFRQAIALNPGYTAAYDNLGNALAALGRYEEAVAVFEKATAVRPDAEVYEHLGNTLHMSGRSAEAVTQHRKALAIRPNSPDFHSSLGQALQAIGRFDEATAAFERALALSPSHLNCLWNLAQSKRFTRDDAHFVAMQELARNTSRFTPEEQIELHFALGKTLADVGDKQQSFQHLLQGNALKRGLVNYNEAATLRRLERIRSAFSAQLLAEKQGAGDPSSVPIFILGMPRSGTSLVEQILASHSKVFGAGELAEMGKLAARVAGPDAADFYEAAAEATGEQLRELGADYVRIVQRLAPAAERITDKMPGNFVMVGLIHLAMPNARIIHTRRDLRDTALSCYSILWPRGMDYSYDLGELGRYCRAYDELMAHWRSVLPAGVMLEVQYEELVGDLEGQARRILAHCGLDWEEACLAFHQTERSVRTASVNQVRQPIYASSIGRWRPLVEHLGPLLRELDAG
jgi:tetratricopeptide (TPR) repeat protein